MSRGDRRRWPRADLVAALSLWAVLVPQGLAYGELAGLAPVAGLYTALGRWWPTPCSAPAAISVSARSRRWRFWSPAPWRRWPAATRTATPPWPGCWPLWSGGCCWPATWPGWGVVTRLLSAPVLTGYLAGSAIVIIVGQLPKVTGIDPGEAGDATVIGVVRNLGDLDPWTLAVAVGTALVVLVVLRLAPRAPAPLIGLALATLVVSLAGLTGRLSVIGQIDTGVPLPGLPDAGGDDALQLLGPAASVALLAFSSSVLTGRSLAARDRLVTASSDLPSALMPIRSSTTPPTIMIKAPTR